MLAELFTWWAQQLRDLLPRRTFGRARFADAVVLRPAGPTLSAAVRRRGVEQPLGNVEPGGAVLRRLRARRAGPVLLNLPPATLLEQQASLPLAAERDLGAVLLHEMDRLTPFRPADLFWTWRVQRRDRAGGKLLVQLLLVPKSAAAASLAALDAMGLRPAAIEVALAAGVEHLPLSPPGGARGRLAARVAAGACAVLAIALVATPVVRQERAIAGAEHAITTLRPGVAAVDALRRRLSASASGSDLFTVEHARVGSPLRALAAVTASLPDDTYLSAFSMRQRSVSLAGQSAAAVKLIGLLASDPDLRDPAFDAPVTRTSGQPGNQADLFSIRVSLAP